MRTAPRILLVSLEAPWPVNRGGRQRTNLLHRALQNCGQVDLLLISDNPFSSDESSVLRKQFGMLTQIEPTPRGAQGGWRWLRKWHPPAVDRLAHNIGSRRIAYAADPKVQQWIKHNLPIDQYDLLVARYTFALTRAGLIGRMPTILDVDDLITSIYRYRMEVPNLPAWQRRILQMHLRQHERRLPDVFSACQGVWVANPDDVQECESMLSGSDERITALPNIPWTAEGSASKPLPTGDTPVGKLATGATDDASGLGLEHAPDDCHSIVTVGSLNYGANLYGVSLFVEQAWPLIRQQVPDAEFFIVGNGMTDAMRDAWGRIEGVRPIGLVDDVAPWYAQAAFAVAPVFYGGGTNIKVLEAFQHRRTCVVTTQAHRGYGRHLHHGESLFVAESVQQLAEGCIKLLRAPHQSRQWADAGRQVVQEHYSWKRFHQVVHETVRKVMHS